MAEIIYFGTNGCSGHHPIGIDKTLNGDEYGFAKGKPKRYFRMGFGKWLTERAFVKKYFSEE